MNGRSKGFFGITDLKLCAMLLSAVVHLPAFSQTQQTRSAACGDVFVTGYGPWDYRTDTDKLPIVLRAHFTPEVEALVRGKTSGTPGGDIDYTLRAIPNNHRALIAIMRLGEKEKTLQPKGTRYTVGCWFERAVRFRPDDSIVRMIYSTFLNSQGQSADANVQLRIATDYAKDNAFTHYNIGLHYFALDDFNQALDAAHKAMALGFPREELKDKLKGVGKWAEPTRIYIPTIDDGNNPTDSQNQ